MDAHTLEQPGPDDLSSLPVLPGLLDEPPAPQVPDAPNVPRVDGWRSVASRWRTGQLGKGPPRGL